MYRDLDFKARAGGIQPRPFRPVKAPGGPVLPVLLLLSLAGCGSIPESVNPVSWWHDLQHGHGEDTPARSCLYSPERLYSSCPSTCFATEAGMPQHIWGPYPPCC